MEDIKCSCEDFDGISVIIENMRTAAQNTMRFLSINTREFMILKAILSSENITSAELSGMFPISKAAVSQFTSSLEKRGFLIRRIGDRDRRRVYFEVTDAGRELVEKGDTYHAEDINIVKNQLGEENFKRMMEFARETAEILVNISENRVKSR